MPGIAEVKGAIGLLSGDRTRDYQRSAGLVAECGTLSVAVSKQEVGEVLTVARTGTLHVPGSRSGRDGRSPRTAERDQAATGVGLQVIVVTLLELHAPNVGVMPANHSDLRRNIELGVEVVDRALSLAATNQGVVLAEARGQRSALNVGNQRVVSRRPTFLRHIKARIDGLAQVVESADAGIDVGGGVWADGEVVANRQALAAGIFSAPVFA